VSGRRQQEFIPNPDFNGDERALKYLCSRCGEGYQVRAPAPTCRIEFLERIEELQAPYASLRRVQRRAVLDVLLRRTFRWSKPVREMMLKQFEQWQAWKAQPGRIVPT
jgi:transposase-like protein